MEIRNNTRYNLLIPIGAVVVLILLTSFLDRIVQEGMFFDGVTYAAISRNLAMGKGDLWDVYYRGPWRFAEHPPLMFWLQAVFFKIFGDTYLTERLYCLVVWLLTIGMLRKLWFKADPGKEFRAAFVLPLLCWGIIPTVMWGYTNNLLDCTMALLDMVAVFWIYNAMQKDKRNIWNIALPALFIFLATLTKGPVGLYPLGVAGLHWLVFRKHSFTKVMVYTLSVTAVLATGYVLLYAYPPARACIDAYFEQQVMMALAGKREVVDSPIGRFQLIPEVLSQLLPAFVMLVVVFLLAKVLKKEVQQTTEHKKHMLFFLLVALSASLPIMLSIKQRSFYLVPAFPFYALAIGLLAYPYFISLARKDISSVRVRHITNGLLIAASLGALIYVITKFGDVGRDHDMIADIKILQQHVPESIELGSCRAMHEDHTLLAYLERYHKLEVNANLRKTRYALVDNSLCGNSLQPMLVKLEYKELPVGMRNYKLYKSVITYLPRYTR